MQERTTQEIQAQHDQALNKRIASLNPAQRQAVEHIYGPLMVIAGPGSGKTFLLTTRIAYILRNTDFTPYNFLCLTFTEAGAAEMKRRLVELIGPAGNRVTVQTFHSFCNNLILENPDRFQQYRLQQPLAELERVKVLRKIVEELSDEHPLRRLRGDLYFETARLGNLFKTMKREALSVEELLHQAQAYRDTIPTLAQFQYKRDSKHGKKGELKPDGLKEQRKMDEFMAAVQLYETYETKLRQMGRYDFEDMINWVAQQLRDDSEFRLSYQERYQLLLVDEYQDTNGAQNEVLNQLMAEQESPNVFAVGDDDQAIFRFQGANYENMAAFAEHVIKNEPAGQILSLAENRRSTQAILDCASAVIDQNHGRLTKHAGIEAILGRPLQKQLTAVGQAAQAWPNEPPVITRYDNANLEHAAALAQLKHWVETEGIDPRKIAVLYRKNNQAPQLIRAAQQQGLPLALRRKRNLLEERPIQHLLNLLHYLQAEYEAPGQGEGRLFELLHYDFWGLDERTSRFVAANRRFRETLADDRSRPRPALADLLEEEHDPRLLPPEESARLHSIARRLRRWVNLLPQSSVPALIETVVNESGLLQQLAGEPQTAQRLHNLNMLKRFYEFVSQEAERLIDRLQEHASLAEVQERERLPQLTLKDLLEVIREMQEEGIAIDLVSAEGEQRGITFSTIHGAKGLEFSHVLMIGCTKRAWEDQRGGSGRDYTYPPTFERDHEELEDERRLFYVAMTRAERTLRISFHEGDRQNPGPTQMIDELAERMALPVHEAELPAATQAMAQASGIALQTQEAASDAERPDYKQLAAYLYSTLAPAAPAAEQLNETPLDPALLEHYALSATGLNTYLACKRKFYYEELLRIPQLQDPNMALGAAVHRSLQDFFTQMQQEAGELPPLATLQQRYREHLARFRGLLSPHQYESFRAWAEQILPGYYATFQEAWRRNVRNEYRIADVAIGSAPVVGRIDKVEFDWDGLHLVDYKAGNPDNGRPQMQRPNEKNPMGRDYWRQLMFYVLLARQDPSLELPVKSAYLEYVPPDRNGQYQRFFLKYDEQELQDMAELIETTDRMIRQEQRFEKLTPAERQAESYDPCAQCRFFSVCWGEAAIV